MTAFFKILSNFYLREGTLPDYSGGTVGELRSILIFNEGGIIASDVTTYIKLYL